MSRPRPSPALPRGAIATVLLAAAFAAPARAADVVPGEVIVRFDAGTSKADRADARRDAGTRAVEGLGLARLQLLQVTDGDSVGATVRQLEADPAVRYAEPNYILRPASVPDDIDFGQLWGLDNTGQTVNGVTGVADADIDAPEAWDVETGDPATVVAVMDTGADLTHPDLQNQLWTNATESAGTPGVDDDGNGYVDDVNGYDFFDDDPVPTDEHGHGTHVSGTVLAEGNNALGVTGVSQEASLMSLRICGPYDDGCPTSDEILAADYAGDNGARVLNGSIEGSFFSSSLRDTLAAHPDTLYVFAAGNGGLDGVGDDDDATPVYPCATDEVGGYAANNIVCVAATNSSDGRASFSNFGADSVDLGAPGTSTWSTSSQMNFFSEDFEVDDFATDWTNDPLNTPVGADWERSNESPLTSFGVTDSPGANYVPNTTSEVTSAAVTLPTGYATCGLNYFRSVALGSGDAFAIEVLLDSAVAATSGDFNSADNSSRNGFFELDHDFDVGGQVQVRLRLESNGSGQANGVHMDDINLVCHGSPSDGIYEFLSGTSMATPHVVGAAALLFSQSPAATASEVKDALLDSVDLIPALDGITVTGGRLNIHRALIGDFNPPPTPGGGGSDSGGGAAATADGAAPNTSFIKKPSRVVHTDDPRVKVVWRFQSTEADSTFVCKLDGQEFKPCGSRLKKKLRPARHKLKVAAIDPAGNRDPTPAVARVKVVRDTD